VIHGCPVSNSIVSILRHSSRAGTFLIGFDLAAGRPLLVAT
jgi:hypothetical protein